MNAKGIVRMILLTTCFFLLIYSSSAFAVDPEMQPLVIDNGSGMNSPVPEPSTMILMALGLLGLAGVSRKK